MFLDLILVVVGVAILAVAADQFVEGAVRLSAALKISPIVIGAVVVGFGTSAPEMLVSGIAAAGGELDVGVGNVVGSNIANLSLVLAAAALVTPITVRSSVLRREAVLSVGSVILFGLLVQGSLGRVEGGILAGLLVVSLVIMISSSVDNEVLTEEVEQFIDGHEIPVGRECWRTIIGLAGTVLGAQMLVEGALGVADELDLSGGFVGATLVALGTSLPELVTAVTAARRRETDLIVGNLLGSNIFNSLAVGGLVAFVGPGEVTDNTMQTVGVTLMIVVALVSWFMMRTNNRVERSEAIVLLLLYVFTVVVLASGDEGEAAFGFLPL